jgi:hypothetical protein
LVTSEDRDRYLRARPGAFAYTLTMNGAADNPLAHRKRHLFASKIIEANPR